MISALTFTVLALSPAAQDAPDRLISKHGVELVADEQVFVLYAALNALGYAEETRRKGPPLEAPVFHPIRIEVRDALREARKKGKTAPVREMFEKNPASIEAYLEAVLAAGSKQKPGRDAAKLSSAIKTLEKFRAEAELAGLFDRVAEEQRALGVTLMGLIDKDFDAARARLGVGELRAPANVIVVPNPLDAHDVVRRVRLGGKTYLVVGPGKLAARRAVLEASVFPAMLGWVKPAIPKAARFKATWDGLKTSRRITSRYPNAEAYLAASLTRAVTYVVRAGKKRNKEGDEEFIDGLAKDGIRWGRVALKILDESNGKKFEEEAAGIIARSSP